MKVYLIKKLRQFTNWLEVIEPKEYLEHKLASFKNRDIENLYLNAACKYRKKMSKNSPAWYGFIPLDLWVATEYKKYTRLLRSLIPRLALADFFLYDYPLLMEHPVRVLPKKTRKRDWAIVVDTQYFSGKKFTLSNFKEGDFTTTIYLEKFIYTKLVYSIVKEGTVRTQVYIKKSRLSPGVYNRVKYTGTILPVWDEKLRVAYEFGQQAARQLLRIREGDLDIPGERVE